MPVVNPLHIAMLAFALLGVAALLVALAAFRSRHAGSGLVATLVGLLLLAVAALAGTVSVGVQGYRALTREVVAATITTERTGPQTFRATVRLPGDQVTRFDLAGDEFYVDAHVLKWQPFVNVLGLHTAYELDRIAGRYSDLEEERTRPRTIYSLAQEKPVDMFHIARRFPFLHALVDAEYGSATFAPTGARSTYEVRVSTSGLLLRPLEAPATP